MKWFLVFSIVVLSAQAIKGNEGFYIIAHMTNTKDSVTWAIGKGANAVEIDLEFGASGNPTKFIHSPNGEFCDCSCLCLVAGLCLNTDSVCAPLSTTSNKKISPCSAYEDAKTLLNHIALKPLALVVVDSKIDKSFTNDKQRFAAKEVIKLLESDLFQKGYNGEVIVGAAKSDALSYITEISKTTSMYKNRIHFTIDMENNAFDATVKKLQFRGNRNVVWGGGISACLPNTLTKKTKQQAAMNMGAGVIGMAYTWTVDDALALKRNAHFFNGIITNKPGLLHKIIRDELHIPLATTPSKIPAATSTHIVTDTRSFKCDCAYRQGGCTISSPPPKGLSCKCLYKGGWTCGGDVGLCRDPTSRYCKNPDTSIHSCAQGQGDCDGYKSMQCDCDFTPGGCKISKSVAPGLACRCKYTLWKCNGEIVKCRDPNSAYCKRPDKNVGSCVQGGGDCGGYSTCDCTYHPGGCTISKAAPSNFACQCKYKGGWTCGGQVTHCRIESSNKCKQPDTSIQSCTLGNGDCDGYQKSCDCNYKSGGCVISSPPPPSTSCRCNYEGFWTCSASVIKCSQYGNHYCQNPDTSKNTCLLGGGDCGGY